MKKKIIAVDFDGTIVKDEYPNIGKIKKRIVRKIKRAKKKGSTVILWTCRVGEYLDAAVNFMNENDIPYDLVNESDPENVKKYGIDTRKVFAHEYWDDRARRII